MRRIEIIPYYEILEGHFSLENEDISVLCLCALFFNDKITRQQLCHYLNKYKTGHLTRKINTYHCRINDKWYESDYFYNILLDVVVDVVPQGKIMTIVDLINILNIGFSKNKNWCINYIGVNIIKPLLSDRQFNLLKLFGFKYDIITYEEAESKYDDILRAGYCCKDCSGCLSEYKRLRYQWELKPNIEELSKMVLSSLMRHKTHWKNPNDKLLWAM